MKVSRALPFVLIVAFLSAGVGQGDEILLKGGGRVEGDVISKGDSQLVLQTAYGNVTFELADISEINYSSALERDIRNQLKALSPSDTAGMLSLASQASAANLSDLSRSIYTQIIAVNPDEKAARRALGYIQFEGEWITQREKNLNPGLVPYRGRWVAPAERDQLRRQEEDARYLAEFDLTPEEGVAILDSMADIDVQIEPRGGHIVRRHVKSLPVKDKPYVYSVDILNWQRLGVFIGVTFIDKSRNRMPGFGRLEYTIYATEADALGNRSIGKPIVSNAVTVKPDMWNLRSDFKYWDTKVNTTYETIASDDEKNLWAREYAMNNDGILYILANRGIDTLAPPGVYYVEAVLTVQDRQKKVGRFVQYAELR